MAKKVVVYTMDYCPFYERAKSLLSRKGIAFEEILLSMDDDSAWDELERRSGMKTMPQIFADGRLIGGYTELAALDSRDGLQSLR